MQTQDGHGRAYDEEERESLWKWQTQDAHGHAYDDEEGESSDGGFGLQEYEFSCSNSPATPVAKRKHYHLSTNILHCSCVRPYPVEDGKEELSAFVLPLLDYDNGSCSKDCLEHSEGNNDHQVDRKAEEFIAKFYEQLRLQNQMSFRRYQEMLDRGL